MRKRLQTSVTKEVPGADASVSSSAVAGEVAAGVGSCAGAVEGADTGAGANTGAAGAFVEYVKLRGEPCADTGSAGEGELMRQQRHENRSRLYVEKFWHGVNVLAKQGSFTINDLVQVVDGSNYVYVRKFLRYLYVRGILVAENTRVGTDWRHVSYHMVAGAERPVPLFTDPAKWARLNNIGVVQETGGKMMKKKLENEGGAAVSSPNETAPPKTEAPTMEPAQKNVSQDQEQIQEQIKEKGQQDHKQANNTTDATKATKATDDTKATSEEIAAAHAALEKAKEELEQEKIHNFRMILNGYYEDLVNRIQYLNCHVHRVRTDTDLKFLYEGHLLLDSIRTAYKLYYIKLLQVGSDVDLAKVFSKVEFDEKILEEIMACQKDKYDSAIGSIDSRMEALKERGKRND